MVDKKLGLDRQEAWYGYDFCQIQHRDEYGKIVQRGKKCKRDP